MPPCRTRVLFNVPAPGVRRRDLHQFANTLQAEVTKNRPFSCLITCDLDLEELNGRYRKRRYPTDVLSFPQLSDAEEIGDIAISFDRAKEQAESLGHPVDDEVRILMLHGALHLLGLDHERDQGEMARAERRWRKRFGLPAGLIERVRT